MAPTVDMTPKFLREPGWLFRAPLESDIPEMDSIAGVFTEDWSVDWIPIGPTAEGSDFTVEASAEPIYIAESYYAQAYGTTEVSTTLAFTMASFTLDRLSFALNGGATVLTGTGQTGFTTYDPPEPGEEVRSMIGWESQNSKIRVIGFKTLNSGSKALNFKKGTDYAKIPASLSFEKVSGLPPFRFYFAGSDLLS
jgi:hypothetical protein